MKLFINGKFEESKADTWIDNFNPVGIYSCKKSKPLIIDLATPSQATNEVVSRVPCTTQEEMKAAVAAASSAFPAWRDTSIMSRQQVMFRLQHLIREKMVGASSFLLELYYPAIIFLSLSTHTCTHAPSRKR